MTNDRLAPLRAVAEGAQGIASMTGVDARAIDDCEAVGRAAYVAGRYADAATSFAGVLALDPGRSHCALFLAFAHAAMGNSSVALEAAGSYLRSGATDTGDAVRARLLRAEMWASRGSNDRALAEVDEAFRLAGGDGELLELVAESRRFHARVRP